MKYAITGSSGFIGMHLSSFLAREGHNLLLLDNANDYYSTELKMLREEKIRKEFGFTTKRVDLSVTRTVLDLISEFEPDVTIHLAAQAGVRLPKNQYYKYVESNLLGHSNVVNASIISEVPNILYASSSSVYGNLDSDSFSEFVSDLQPVSFYGATKLSNEICSKALVRDSNSKIRGLRFFTVYGPWGRPDMAYFKLIQSAILEKEFVMFGDGTILRDFTYIDDVVESVKFLITDLSKKNAAFSDVVNIGGGIPKTMRELIEVVERVSGKSIKLFEAKKASGDVNKTIANFSYLNELTGFTPSTSLETGILKTFEWASNPEINENFKNWH